MEKIDYEKLGVIKLSEKENSNYFGGVDPWTVVGVLIAAVMFLDYAQGQFQTGQEIYRANHK
jgi:hypothetical protein